MLMEQHIKGQQRRVDAGHDFLSCPPLPRVANREQRRTAQTGDRRYQENKNFVRSLKLLIKLGVLWVANGASLWHQVLEQCVMSPRSCGLGLRRKIARRHP